MSGLVSKYLEQNNMTWEAIPVDLYGTTEDNQYIDCEKYMGIARNDTLELLGIRKASYTICQNIDAFSWLDEFLESGRLKFSGCSEYNNGAVTYFEVSVAEQDLGDDYLSATAIVSNSFDGSKTLEAKSMIYYCDTEDYFFFAGSKGTTTIRARHTKRGVPKFLDSTKFFDAQTMLFIEDMELIRRLKAKKLIDSEIKQFIAEAFDIKPGAKVSVQQEDKLYKAMAKTEGEKTLWRAFTATCSVFGEKYNDYSHRFSSVFNFSSKLFNKTIKQLESL